MSELDDKNSIDEHEPENSSAKISQKEIEKNKFNDNQLENIDTPKKNDDNLIDIVNEKPPISPKNKPRSPSDKKSTKKSKNAFFGSDAKISDDDKTNGENNNLPLEIFSKIKEEKEDTDGQDPNSKKKGNSSYKSAAFQIANTIMGAGILSIPTLMRYTGILLGSIFIIFIAIVTVYTVDLLIKCESITGKSGYNMFGKITMGSFGSILVKITIIISNFGICCAYLRIFGETANTTLRAFIPSTSYLITNWHNYLYILIISALMLFFIFQDKIDSLKKVSIIGIIAISVFVISVIILFIYKAAFSLFDEKIKSSYLKPNCTPAECLQALPSVFLAFTFQFNVFPIYFSLKHRNRSQMLKATKYGVIFCLAIFLLTGLFGFLMYGTRMNDTILNELNKDMIRFKSEDNFIKFVVIIISIGFVVSCLMSFPPMFFSLKKNLINSFIFCNKKCRCKNKKSSINDNKNVNEVNVEVVSSNNNRDKLNINEEAVFNSFQEKIIIIILYVLIVILTILIPKLKIIFHIVGSTGSNLISFILPSLFYIRINRIGHLRNSLIIPAILLLIGMVFLVMSLIISLMEL